VELKQKQAQIAVLESKIEDLKAKHAYFETVTALLEALELRNNHSIQITAEQSLRDKSVAKMKRSKCPCADGSVCEDQLYRG
jgi:hypothetical protein